MNDEEYEEYQELKAQRRMRFTSAMVSCGFLVILWIGSLFWDFDSDSENGEPEATATSTTHLSDEQIQQIVTWSMPEELEDELYQANVPSIVTEEENVSGNSQQMTWAYYQSVLSQEEYASLEKYIPILNEKEPFVCFDMENEEITLEEYFYGLSDEITIDTEMIYRFAVVDLDADETKEFILYTALGGGRYLILSEQEETIYGFSYSVREFQNLQTDGKFMGSGGAADTYFYTLDIHDDGVVENCFGEYHGELDEQGNYSYRFVVNGVETEDYEAWFRDNYSAPVVWYEAN